MKVYQYKITLQSDTGKVTRTVTATSEVSAKRIILGCELCPESAILKIENLGEVC